MRIRTLGRSGLRLRKPHLDDTLAAPSPSIAEEMVIQRRLGNR